MNKPSTINNNKTCARPATAGLSLENGCVNTCVPANITVLGSGHFNSFGLDRPGRSPERIAKAQEFHAKLKIARKNPANCCRCGKPRDGLPKQCAKCRAYQARYRGKLVDRDAKLTGSVVVAMVKQMRREMDRMQARFKLWKKAADYRRNLHYRTNSIRKKYFKPVAREDAMDYLAQTNHAYQDHED